MNYFKIPSLVKIKGLKPANSFNKNQIAKSFNEAAEGYDGASVFQKEIANRLLEHLDFIEINPRVILDLGAGTGYTTTLLRKRYPKARIIALDIAENTLLQSRKKFGWVNKPQYICGNMEQLPLQEGSVDLVISNLALHWSTNLNNALVGINQILHPKGLLLFSTLGLDTLKEMRESWRAIDGEVHVHDFVDMHDVGDTLARLQFMDPVMEMEYLILTYKDIKTLFSDLKATGFHNIDQARSKVLIGKNKFKKFLSEYETFRREDGFLPATFEVVYGHARRSDLSVTKSTEEVVIPVNEILRKKA